MNPQPAEKGIANVAEVLAFAPAGHERDVRQSTVLAWCSRTFGGEAATNPRERISRFTEEAIELAQAGGLSKEDVIDLVNYVYSRPAGEIHQEVGGVGISLLAYCERVGISAEAEEVRELNRVLSFDPEKFRAKQNAKAASGVACPCDQTAGEAP